MNESANRGISDRQTTLSLENIRSIIPNFTGENALTVIDAFHTYRTKLSQSGMSRTMWGNIILSKISGEAKTRISIPAQREPNIDKIEKELMDHYGSSLKVSARIMDEHKKIGKIPDPHNENGVQGTLKILQSHAEVIEYADRYLKLTKEETAESNMLNGTNIQDLLELLPIRVRDTEGMSKAILEEKERINQYEKFKEWINKSIRTLIEQGIKAEETTRSEVTLISNANNRQQEIGRAHV